MKKVGQILEELGFRKDAPTNVQEAFLKHLIKAAYGAEVQTPSDQLLEKQLSFEFMKETSNKKVG